MFHVKQYDKNLLFIPENNIDVLKVKQLYKLVDLIECWNINYNITSDKDKNSIWIRHVVDCLQIYPFIKEIDNIIDVGSGFGFPTLPLAIIKPETKFTIIEPNIKKNQLCRYALQDININNVKIISQRIEDVDLKPVEVVCCRAWGKFKNNAHTVYPFLIEKGFFITFKQQKELEIVDGYFNLQNYSYCLGNNFPKYNIVTMQKKEFKWEK